MCTSGNFLSLKYLKSCRTSIYQNIKHKKAEYKSLEKPNFVTICDVSEKAERKQPCLGLLVLLHLERKRVIYLLPYVKGFRLLLGRKRGEMALTIQAMVFTQSSLWFCNIFTPILVHTHLVILTQSWKTHSYS